MNYLYVITGECPSENLKVFGSLKKAVAHFVKENSNHLSQWGHTEDRQIRSITHAVKEDGKVVADCNGWKEYIIKTPLS